VLFFKVLLRHKASAMPWCPRHSEDLLFPARTFPKNSLLPLFPAGNSRPRRITFTSDLRRSRIAPGSFYHPFHCKNYDMVRRFQVKDSCRGIAGPLFHPKGKAVFLTGFFFHRRYWFWSSLLSSRNKINAAVINIYQIIVAVLVGQEVCRVFVGKDARNF